MPVELGFVEPVAVAAVVAVEPVVDFFALLAELMVEPEREALS